MNLVSNSLKFTKNEGTVTVKLDILDITKTPNKPKLDEISGSQYSELSKQSNFIYCDHGMIKRRTSSNKFSTNHNFSDMNFNHLRTKSIQNILTDLTKDYEYCYNRFQIKIQDTGKGISQSNIDKLFINFNTLDENKDLNPRGTGLGLSICK